MGKPRDLVIDDEIFNKMLDCSILLFKQIENKQENNDTITQEEADWANSFLAYVHAITEKMEETVKKRKLRSKT